ncbi:hypothetical protein E9993_14915 [Labilibacter sediminis]|nr:hypothetical protein E9993_14915 [Labilibacter sediminis]
MQKIPALKSEGKTTVKTVCIGGFFLLTATLLVFWGAEISAFSIEGSVLANQDSIEQVICSNDEVNEPTNNSNGKGSFSSEETIMDKVELNIGDIGSFDHQGTTYTWKVMDDGKKWLTRNLNVELDNSWCYDNDSNYCETYGRLYTWKAAKQACLSLGDNWRLPSDEDWKNLAIEYGGYHDWRTGKDIGKPRVAYRTLMEEGGSGFAASLGGWRDPEGIFDYLGDYGIFWSSSLRDSSDARGFGFYRNDSILARGNGDLNFGHSVRCVQDL